MPDNLSNNIKALLYLGDLTRAKSLAQSNCFTVQEFDYRYFRSRDEAGIPWGATQSAVIRFTLKSLPNGQAKPLYQRLLENEEYPYTLLFNATFDASRSLVDYQEAIVASGYLIHLDERFSTESNPANTTGRMLMNVQLIMQSITYLSAHTNKQLILNKY